MKDLCYLASRLCCSELPARLTYSYLPLEELHKSYSPPPPPGSSQLYLSCKAKDVRRRPALCLWRGVEHRWQDDGDADLWKSVKNPQLHLAWERRTETKNTRCGGAGEGLDTVPGYSLSMPSIDVGHLFNHSICS